MTEPIVSIITVCLNSKNNIEKSINSVLSQQYPFIEYVVIDGGSTDGTQDIINQYLPKIAHFISEEDQGMYYALNKGVRKAKGDLIGILHSDDIYSSENVISNVVSEFIHKGVDAVYGNVIYVGHNNKVVRTYISPKDAIAGFQKALQPAHPAFFVKKEIYHRYGLYNTNYKIGSDYELLLRFLGTHKISYSYLDKYLVIMKNGGLSNRSFSNIIRNNIEVYRASKSHNFPVGIFTIALKLISKFFNLYKLKS